MITKKLRIAVIGLKGLPAFGGAATVGENIIEQLKDKYDFTVYSTSSHTQLKTGEYNGCKQIVFRKLPFKKLNTLYYYIISAFHVVLFGDFNLVHLHHRDAAFIILVLKLKYKIVITTHGSFWVRDKWKRFTWFFQLNEQKFVKKANIVTCVSMEDKRRYKSEVGLDAIYIPNGIALYSKEVNLNYNQENEPYLFFGAGRIIGSKGLEVLIKALHILHYKGILLVAGDLDQTLDYKKEILDLTVGLNVKFLGMVKDKRQLLFIIANAKLFIFPSSLEAMSMMLLEAASTKCPCIVSDIIPNKDIFDSNEVLFFETNKSDDLASKIKFALLNPDIMKVKAEMAYCKLAGTQQWEQISKQYSLVYNQLLTI